MTQVKFKRALAMMLALVMVITMMPAQAFATSAVKHGVATVQILHESKESDSMCAALFDEHADITVENGTATVKLLVANPIPNFPDKGKEGTVKNFVLSYMDANYSAECDVKTKPNMTASKANPMFGVEIGKQYTADILTISLPEEALTAEAPLNGSAIVDATGSTVKFRVSFGQVNWDEEQAPAQLEDGAYQTVISLMHESKNQLSMCNVLFGSYADIVVKGKEATLKLLVVNPVPAYPEQGTDGTVKNVKITYDGKQYAAESQLGTDAKIIARESNPMYGIELGKEYSAQVLTVKLPAAAIQDGALLKTDAFVNVVMNSPQVFRIELGGLVKMADYSKVDAALGTIPKDLSIYTDATVAPVEVAKKNVMRGLEVSKQADVDRMAADLEAAISGLVKITVLEDGAYKAMISMNHENKNQPSMFDPVFDVNADVVVKGEDATMKILVANPVPAFPDQGADGTVKNVKITYAGKQYDAKSELKTGTKMTAKVTNGMFGLKVGEKYDAQVLTVKLPAKAVYDGALLKTDAYVNVAMNSNQKFRIALINFVKMADYSKVDAALGTIPKDLSIYTDATVAPVEAAIKAVKRDLEVSKQADIDNMATAIEEAVKGLVEIKNLEDGIYKATIAMKHEYKDQNSMCDPMFDGKANIVVKGEEATMKILVANPVPAFKDQGADGTVKNVVVNYGGKKYNVESELKTGTKMTAKTDSTLFGLTSGETYDAQVLTVKLPAKAVYDGALLKTDAYVNVVMNTDVVFRIALTDFVKMADYSKVDAALGTIPKDLSIYTDATVAPVEAAIKAVKRDLEVSKQADVDKMAKAIEEAVKGLVEIKNLEDGIYKATIAMKHEYKDQNSMCDPMFDGKADIVVKGDEATMKILVANPVPGFPDQGADGTVKNVKVTYDGKQYDAKSELKTGTKMTAKTDSSLFGLTSGETYDAQVLTVKLPAKAVYDGALLKTDAYVNVVMNTDVVFRIALTDFVKMADYSKVDAALGTIPKDLSIYTDATVKAVTEAKNAIERGLEFSRQTDVDNMAKAITEAVAGLKEIEKPVEPTDPPIEDVIKEGKYIANATMLHETRDQASMCDPMFDGNADIEVKGEEATLKLLVANPVPGFPDQGADGTVKNVKVTYDGKQYDAKSELKTGTKMTAKTDSTLFGLISGEKYAAQVLTVTLPKAAINEGAILKTDCFVNVVMNTDVVFRIKLYNLKEVTVTPDVPGGDVTPVPPVEPEKPAEPTVKPDVVKPILPVEPPKEGADLGMDKDQQVEADKTIGDIITDIVNPTVKPEPPKTEAEKETVATEEKIAEAAKNNDKIKVNVETEKVDEEKASDTIKKEIADIKDKVKEIYSEVGGKLLQFADIKVTATAVKADGTTEDLGNLRNLDKKLSFTFQLPMDTEGDKFGVIRYHDGKAEIIPATDVTYDPVTKKITFLTDKFSTYAVFAYDKEPEVTPVPPVRPAKVQNLKVRTDYGLLKVTFDKSKEDVELYRIAVRKHGDKAWKYYETKNNSLIIKKLNGKALVKSAKYDVMVAAVRDKAENIRSYYTKVKTVYANKSGVKAYKMYSPKFESIKRYNSGKTKVVVRNVKYTGETYQVAFRVKGTKTWKNTHYNTKTVRYIKGLKKGKTYQFKVNYRYKSKLDGKTYVTSKNVYKTVKLK